MTTMALLQQLETLLSKSARRTEDAIRHIQHGDDSNDDLAAIAVKLAAVQYIFGELCASAPVEKDDE